MKLKKFREKDNKRIGIIVFTIVCILLVSGVILYRTFAIFEVNTNQNVINGTVEDPGDVYFAIYVDNEITKKMPEKNSNYVLDYSKSYCGILGDNDPSIYVNYTPNDGLLIIDGMKEQRTKCTLYFVKGENLIDKIKNISQTNQNEIREVTHDDANTIDGFKKSEYRYVGTNPNNYVTFNNEKAGFRIIGLVNVMTDDNTVEQRIKLISTNEYKKLSWDTNNSNDWANASLRNILNTEYYNHFSIYNRNLIEKVVWNLGANDGNIHISTSAYYEQERNDNVKEGNAPSVYDFIALMYPSDYGYATNKESCYSSDLRKWNEDSDCYTNDWLYYVEDEWTLTHQAKSADGDQCLMYLHPLGVLDNSRWPNSVRGVKPVFYLNPNAFVNSDADGSADNPFQISL